MIHLAIEPGTTVNLDNAGDAPSQVHLFDERSINAVNAALAANRPLLVRGEPGTGKTQLARAVAAQLGWAFLSETIHSSSVATDLLYRVDAVTRLGEAQIMAMRFKDTEKDHDEFVREVLDEKRFIHPGPLWWAFDWDYAKSQAAIMKEMEPHQPDGGDHKKGCVLLIDEIDKADSDLPNGLLEAFGNGRFNPPAIEKTIYKNNRPLLVVITTNEERALPDAFLRRCLVLVLEFDENDPVTYLVKHGNVHFGDDIHNDVLEEAARQLIEDRKMWQKENLCAPGLAEYLDMVRVLKNMADTKKEQLEVLKKIKRFILKKHPRVYR